jgi:hypothetical protein
MCEDGVKYRDIHGQLEITGFANGVVHGYHDIAAWAEDEKKTVVLATDNFGRDEVVVRKATQICQTGRRATSTTSRPRRSSPNARKRKASISRGGSVGLPPLDWYTFAPAYCLALSGLSCFCSPATCSSEPSQRKVVKRNSPGQHSGSSLP